MIIFIGLLLKTSRSFGIFGANTPNTIHANVLPIAQSKKGITPLFCDIVIPFNKLPALAHVAAMLIA